MTRFHTIPASGARYVGYEISVYTSDLAQLHIRNGLRRTITPETLTFVSRFPLDMVVFRRHHGKFGTIYDDREGEYENYCYRGAPLTRLLQPSEIRVKDSRNDGVQAAELHALLKVNAVHTTYGMHNTFPSDPIWPLTFICILVQPQYME